MKLLITEPEPFVRKLLGKLLDEAGDTESLIVDDLWEALMYLKPDVVLHSFDFIITSPFLPLCEGGPVVDAMLLIDYLRSRQYPMNRVIISEGQAVGDNRPLWGKLAVANPVFWPKPLIFNDNIRAVLGLRPLNGSTT
ncbi:MAG: hypothetical protein WCT24_03625 [Patescibacteria group bacterium]